MVDSEQQWLDKEVPKQEMLVVRSIRNGTRYAVTFRFKGEEELEKFFAQLPGYTYRFPRR